MKEEKEQTVIDKTYLYLENYREMERYINDAVSEVSQIPDAGRYNISAERAFLQSIRECGLSVSEYLRQRPLGYMPKAILPEIFFSFNDKLDELCVAVEGKIATDTEEKIIALIDGITAELILPQKEKAVV